jgi:capsular exopolysaccharide synthesis family protein
MLLRDASVEATRVVMVTSAVTGEGKTTLASQLAGSLARAGRKTLLIDCDLRSPTAHQLFEQPLQPGFSEVLLGEVHLAEATRSTPVDGLFMIPAGQWDREVMHALARDGLDEIFDKLKADYDFIIVDSHPVLAATDSLLVGQYTDAVLFSLLRDVSQAPRVYNASQRLASLSIRVLGAVVNGMEQEEYAANGRAQAAAAA